jgi:hypothetical protein
VAAQRMGGVELGTDGATARRRRVSHNGTARAQVLQ